MLNNLELLVTPSCNYYSGLQKFSCAWCGSFHFYTVSQKFHVHQNALHGEHHFLDVPSNIPLICQQWHNLTPGGQYLLHHVRFLILYKSPVVLSLKVFAVLILYQKQQKILVKHLTDQQVISLEEGNYKQCSEKKLHGDAVKNFVHHVVIPKDNQLIWNAYLHHLQILIECVIEYVYLQQVAKQRLKHLQPLYQMEITNDIKLDQY